jgi:hypothetical protein
VDDAVYNAPTGFDITGFVNVVNQIHSHGSTGVTISPDRKVLTVHAKADSYICFEDSGVCVDCPDEVDKWTRWAGRQVQVQLWSTEPTRKVGTRASLLITTRALCCCDRLISPPEGGIYVAELPRELAVLPVQQAFATLAAGLEATIPSAPIGEQPQLNETVRSATYAAAQKPAGFCSCGGDRAAGQTTMPASTHGMAAVPSLRRANAISDVVRAELTKCITTAELRPWSSSFVDTNLFARQLEGIMSRTRCGRKQLTDQAEMPLKLARVLAARLNRQPEELTRRDVLRYQAEDLARESGMSVEEIRRVNLAALGVRVQQRRPKTGGEKARGKGAQDAQE